jgi:hypothetical protein
MVICLDKPHPELTKNLSLEGRIEKSFENGFTVESTHDNQAEFKRLVEEDRWLSNAYAAASGALVATIAIPEPVTKLGSLLVGTVGVNLVLKRTQKINNILRNGRALNEAFTEQEIQIFTDLPVPDQGRLDMLVKFPLPPKKAVFAIALRSQGKATVFYNEQKESLYVRTSGSGLKPWKPDHIERLGIQGFWLRQNRQEELFGTSSRDKNRPVIKLLVVTGETKIGQHSDHLYTEIGDQRVLLLQRRSSIYVLKEGQLLPFIKAWLAPSGQ